MDIANLQYNVQVLKDLVDNAARVKKLTSDAYYQASLSYDQAVQLIGDIEHQASLSYDQAVHLLNVANQQLNEAVEEVQS